MNDTQAYIKIATLSDIKQLTFNTADEYFPVLSPDGTKIAYQSYGVQPMNLQGDGEIYRVNVLDGSDKKNLTNNGGRINDTFPDWGRQGM